MTVDPFQGRAPSEGAPYDCCLTITPDDDADLPVIPSAIYVALWATIPHSAEGEVTIPNSHEGHNGDRPNYVVIEAQNGERLEMHLPALVDMQIAAPILLPVRPRKILRSGTTLAQVTLLW
jgi:hypothetical protein